MSIPNLQRKLRDLKKLPVLNIPGHNGIKKGNLQFPLFQETVIAFVIKNDMVQEFNAEGFTDVFQYLKSLNYF